MTDFTVNEISMFILDAQPIIYNTIAVAAILLWDLLITFSDEVQYIWKYKISLVNILYIIIRYVSLGNMVVGIIFETDLVHPDAGGCKGWIWSRALSWIVVSLCSETLFVVRVFAFYSDNLWLRVSLLITFICEVTSYLVIICIGVPKVVTFTNPLPPHLQIGSCIIEEEPVLLSAAWIPVLIFQSVLFGLIVSKFLLKHVKNRRDINIPRLLVVFMRDGIWAYGINFSAWLFAVIGYRSRGVAISNIAVIWCFAVVSFSSSRLVLNLRSAPEKEELYVVSPAIRFESSKKRLGFENFSTSTYFGTESSPSENHPLGFFQDSV